MLVCQNYLEKVTIFVRKKHRQGISTENDDHERRHSSKFKRLNCDKTKKVLLQKHYPMNSIKPISLFKIYCRSTSTTHFLVAIVLKLVSLNFFFFYRGQFHFHILPTINNKYNREKKKTPLEKSKENSQNPLVEFCVR